MSTKLRQQVNHWLHTAQYWLLPGLCLVCAQASGRREDLCPSCARSLPQLSHACTRCASPLPAAAARSGACGACLLHPPPFQRCLAPWHYQAPIDQLITRLKYHQDLAVAGLLGRRLATWLRAHYAEAPLPELLLPVPLHPRRLAQRGYNQALELARPLARALELPLDWRHCRRSLHTAPQQGLNAAELRRNLRGAFALAPGHRFRGRRLALLDDVITTMSTTGELARLLLAEGASEVHVWALARA